LLRQTGVPDLHHVDDLIAVKLHNIHLVRTDSAAHRWNQPTLAVWVPLNTPYAATLLRMVSVANDFTSYPASGRTVMMAFIQFAYSAKVFPPSNGSA
jgi:hypothetical protein